MNGTIIKAALVLGLSAGSSVAIAQTEQPQILKKKPGQRTEQRRPVREAEKRPGHAIEGTAGAEPMKKPPQQN